MKREHWEFQYKAEEVAAGAKKQAAYHATRESYWSAEQAEAEAALKEKGFEYRERHFSGGHDVEVVGDPELLKRCRAATTKKQEHAQQKEDYERWVTALERQTGTLQLEFDDINYFKL